MSYKNNLAIWKKALAEDRETLHALYALEENKEAVEDAFYKDLSFGTAGMRGVIGLGTNRMNIYTVRRATIGFAKYLCAANKQQQGVAIAYDSRHMSAEFAKEAALVLCSFGVKVFLYSTMHSVPQLSYTILHLGCAGGIVITASHNPAQYNGYKVYGEDGGQMGVAEAEELTTFIMQTKDHLSFVPILEAKALNDGLLCYIGEDVDAAYYKDVLSLLEQKECMQQHGSALKIVYTPLFGTGSVPIVHLLREIGIEPFIVASQAEANGSFPGLDAPNPESAQAFTEAIALANQKKADVILATDPDCDRLGVAVRNHAGEFVILTGNQIGCFLLHHLATTRNIAQMNAPFAVRSIVSTPMADSIAKKHKFAMRAVYTGFKNIAAEIADSLASGQGTFLFGFEESYGYLAGTFVRDKDASIAAMLFSEAACVCQQSGQSLYDAILGLYTEYGFYGETVISLTLEGKAGAGKIAAAVASFRNDPPTHIGMHKVTTITDYLAQTKIDLATAAITSLSLPSSDVITLSFENGYVTFRPSGTEPKLKAYVGYKGTAFSDMEDSLKALENAVNTLLSERTQ